MAVLFVRTPSVYFRIGGAAFTYEYLVVDEGKCKTCEFCYRQQFHFTSCIGNKYFFLDMESSSSYFITFYFHTTTTQHNNNIFSLGVQVVIFSITFSIIIKSTIIITLHHFIFYFISEIHFRVF